MSEQMYLVSLLPEALTREQSIRQICESLKQVDAISADILSSINSKLNSYRNRFQHLSKRVSIAENKVQALKCRTNEAITVYSAPHYPDMIMKYPPFQCLFDRSSKNIESETLDSSTQKVIFEKLNAQIAAKEKKVHYSVLVEPNADKNAIYSSTTGYGLVPLDAHSVSDLLVFNTSLNPYVRTDRYEDPLTTRSKTRHTVETDESRSGLNGIESAPVTITNSILNERDTLEVFAAYKPTFADVPDFDMPEVLPDLPGIAKLKLPNVSPLSLNQPSTSLSPRWSDPTLSLRTDSISTVATPIRILTTSSPTAIPQASRSTAISSLSSNPAKTPPPPPPPPPPPLSLSPKLCNNSPNAKDTAAVPATAATPDRNDLLKSIREAGGAANFKFRSAQSRRRDHEMKRRQQAELDGVADSYEATLSSSRSTTTTPAVAGDMMADLTRALSLRRRGIAGVKSSSTVLARLSDVIPSPPPAEQVSEAEADSADDNEWEDR